MTFIIKGRRHVFSKKQVERALTAVVYDTVIEEVLSGNFDYTDMLTNDDGMVENITIEDFIKDGFVNPDYDIAEQGNWEGWLSNLDRTRQGAYIVDDGDDMTTVLALLLKKPIYGFNDYNHCKKFLVLDQDWVDAHNAKVV